jgi:hypothetical protein
MQMRNSRCHRQWWWQQHQQIKNCSSSLVVFGMHIDELWIRQILCSGHRRSQNNLDAATCRNLDIAGSVYNLLTCHSCTTLHNIGQHCASAKKSFVRILMQLRCYICLGSYPRLSQILSILNQDVVHDWSQVHTTILEMTRCHTMYVFHIRTYIKTIIIYQPLNIWPSKYLINFPLINAQFIYSSK